MDLRRLCEWVSAAALAALVLIASGAAASRYFLSYVPPWTESILIILVLLSVAFSVGPGLQDGTHISIRLVVDRLPGEGERRLERLVQAFTLMLGVAFFLSGTAHAIDLFQMGFLDFAGVPQWIRAAIAGVFGLFLALFSLPSLIGRRPGGAPHAPDGEDANRP